MSVPDPVVDPRNLPAGARLLDVRPEPAFAAGHLRGAVRVPIERWEAAAKEAATALDNEAFWAGEIGALGVDGHGPVFVYDDGRLIESARVWFILQHFGVPARVVNGGWPQLSALSADRIGTGPAAATPVVFRPAGKGPVGLQDKAGVGQALGSATQIFDSRTAAEFAGEDLRRNARGGHLPGAIHLAHADLLAPEGGLRPAAELQDLLARAGFKAGDRIVTHCDGGGRAALAAIAALRAGYTDVDVYYLSFADWARDESCPIVRD